MGYETLSFPPGMSSNGTLYQNRGLWYSGDRIRWHRKLVQPIGGWETFNTSAGPLDAVILDPSVEVSRALKSWQINAGGDVYVVGTNLGLKAFSVSATTVYDITPADFIGVPLDAATSDGYGMWYYGRSAYGTPRPVDATDTTTFNWCMRNWGENLLAAPRGAPSKLYEWAPVFTNPAVAVANAPEDFSCFHVTEQRIVMVAGGTAEPREIIWSDSEDNTLWAPDLTNQAGSQTLAGAGKVLEIVDFRDIMLVVTETDVHTCRYLGPPYIFGFDKIGDDCGAVNGSSVVATENFVVWPGAGAFYIFDGSVRRLECSVFDKVSAAVSGPNVGKTVGFVNPQWSEIWWLYQGDTGSSEVDSYVVWDYDENHWFTGTLDRSVGGGLPVTGGPFMMGFDGVCYQHELTGIVPSDIGASEITLESGPIELTKGDTTQYIGAIQPDFIKSGEVELYIIGQDRPGGPETRFGPYLVSYPANTTQPVPCRARGNTVRLEVVGKSSTWSLGDLRLDFTGVGGKK